jgi:hypothetical protein
VYSVAFSPDGTRIVSGSDDDTLRLWDAATGHLIGPPITGHTDAVNCVAFSPDGERIISGSGDKTVRLWDSVTGQSIGAPLTGHTEWVYSVAFSPDGTRIVSGSWDQTLRMWDASLTWDHYACRMVNRNLLYEEWRQYFHEQPYPIICPDALDGLNHSCWYGSIGGQAAKVMNACEKAVELASKDKISLYRDSRGLARALTGNFAGAIEDFQVFVDSTDDEEQKAQRQQWIEALQKGGNPFTSEVLEELK